MYVGRCGQILAESEEAQMCVLRNVWELWQRHSQMVCVLVDKMLKTQIVECSAVATWLFSKEMAPHFTSGYLWEILHLTIDKMNKHVTKLSETRFYPYQTAPIIRLRHARKRSVLLQSLLLTLSSLSNARVD